MKIITRKRFLRFIITITILIALVISGVKLSKTDEKVIMAKNGVFDLKKWNNTSNVISLDGQWDFYWKHFLTDEEIRSDKLQPDLSLKVPSIWNNYAINGKKLSGFGYGTYQLKVVNAPTGHPLVIKMPTILTSFKLYIDGNLVSNCGKVGTSKGTSTPGCKSQEAKFTPTKQSFTIIIHIANYTYADGGLCYSIKMGTSEQMGRRDKTISDLDLFLFGALMIMAFYYLCIFFRRRDDKSTLYVVLMFILLAAMTAISGDFLIYRLIPFISYRAIIAINFIVLSWSSICAAYIISAMCPEEVSGKVLKVGTVYASIVTSIILITPMSFYSQFSYVVYAGALLFGLYCIFALTVAFIRGKNDSLKMLLLALLVMLCALHDMLYQSYASRLGSLIFLFLQTFILAKRHSEAFNDVNNLSQKLLQLDKIKDEFLANTSHELRTPLNGILGITEAMLKGSSGELNSHQRANLNTISACSRRLSNLVNDILDYSKMKNGEINLYIKPIKINSIINTNLYIIKQLIQSKECEVVFENTGDLPLIMGDENRITQILYNLIGNAVKFTEKGYVKISARIKADMLELCISDTGEGIPKEKLEVIFKSFEQVDNSMTRRHGGTGLGLSITKQLVELQGGSIWVESRVGEGSKFYFTLPLYMGEQVEEKNEEQNEEQEYVYPNLAEQEVSSTVENIDGDVRILLVDDDIVNLKAASSLLKLEGYGITSVLHGQTALKLLENHNNFSLVILDVMMPEMSGYEICKKIREVKSRLELPILMLTARNTIKDIVLGFEAGANDYLSKPFEPEELSARVRILTELKTSADKSIAAELAFLQSQIKPHFLFNTLNTISSFCNTNPELAQQLIDNYAEYLRETFDFKVIEMEQPIEKELHLVKLYIEIEKARFGDDLNVIFDIDPSINVNIPKLTIQPLVENAIVHGIRKKGGKGTVIIRVNKVPEGVLVAVEDDGQGIPQEKLETLLDNVTDKGIGLWNIDRRLRKQYKKGITIESTLGKGTKIFYIITRR